MSRPTVSLNMIVKNEEKYLTQCLESVKGIFDEIIIIDTGSTDDTKNIAKNFGAKVIDFEWIDDFSAARNFAIESSTGDWIFWLDGHDCLHTNCVEKFKNLIINLKDSSVGYIFMRYVHHTDIARRHEPRVRLFPNRDEIRWKYRVHEQIIPSLEKIGATFEKVDIEITNLRRESFEAISAKRDYYFSLLTKDLEEYPKEISPRSHMADACYRLEKYDEAINHYRKYFDLLPDQSEPDKKALLQYIKCLFLTSQFPEGWEALNKAKVVFPKDVNLMNFEAMMYKTFGEVDLAEKLLNELITYTYSDEIKSEHFDPASPRVVARYNLGYIYLEQGNENNAEESWNLALTEFPECIQALQGLITLYKNQNRTRELKEAKEKLQMIMDLLN